ncbi:pyridoxine/pyridoxamine 5'-phosphate oxidase [Streptomyces sp. NPDC004126]|uniref:pyridoxine/pyridoxamine 5'-phosphate oxidase n=1 Tax=Streptomyces sp. NPDC004126 TaxID=3390695 RepID=UPI003D025E0E
MNGTDGMGGNVRGWLRALPVFEGPLASFDPGTAPEDPVDLFLDWLRSAVSAGVPDAHAMTVATLGEDGVPDARVLIVKNVDAAGWQFAAHASSPKGRQLAAVPSAALTFYWPVLGRQVRVRGPVVEAGAEASAADLLARAVSARAEVLVGRQSKHLADEGERDRLVRAALARLEAEPELVSPQWILHTVVPSSVEFWQADKDRLHTRLRYERPHHDRPWRRHLLWS